MTANTCMVISGEWRCSRESAWEFILDARRLSRVIVVEQGSSLRKLKQVVAHEYGLGTTGEDTISLSYWSSNVDGFATSTKTPPVMLTNDAGVVYFTSELEAKNAKNLFVRFLPDKEVTGGVSEKLDNPDFTTPVCTKSRILGFDLNTPASQSEVYTAEIPTVGSKVGPVMFDDEELLSFIEEEEEREKSCSRKSGESSKSPWDLGIDSESSEDDDDDVDMEDVIPTPGYDTEFWDPFLDEAHGGSRAPEIMFDNDGCPPKITKSAGSGNGTKGMGHMDQDTRNNPDTANHPKRNLQDIDDEEFDIPPLFDDTEFEVADIPDLDKFDDEQVITVGKVYKSRSDLQISLALYAIKKMVHHDQSRTKTDYVVFSCSDTKCDWRVTARELKDCGYYKIRKAHLHHTCSIVTRSRYREKATSKVIAAVYKAKYGTPGVGPLAMDLQQMVLEDLRVHISYMKGWRAKDKAKSMLWGTEEESYEKLPTYLHLLKAANPGTVTDLETVKEDDNNERFKYVFLAFGASINGFKFCRRVLVVDGTHLSGKYKGVLLTASGQDANFQVFPLAYAVVDSENDDSWTWFLKNVAKIVRGGDDLTIISDRCQSIYKAKDVAFPEAKHAACIVHLARNIVSKFKSKGLSKLVSEAAFAFKVGEFNKLFNKIRLENPNCAKFLEKIKLKHWTRSCFEGNRYNLMTSNIAESLNNALRKGRSSPIVELLRFIQAMMTRWFSARRKKSANQRGGLPAEVEKVMTKNKCYFIGSKVNRISTWGFEVIGVFGGKTVVHLDTRRCSCRAYDLLQIPCGHALVAADFAGITYPRLVPAFFRTSAWVDTYRDIVQPAADEDNVDVPQDLAKKLFNPPKTKKPPGREKEGRIPSQGEIQSKTSSKKTAPNRCGRCRGLGHNRTSCKNPI